MHVNSPPSALEHLAHPACMAHHGDLNGPGPFESRYLVKRVSNHPGIGVQLPPSLQVQ